MLVCECQGLTEDRIRMLIRSGFDTLPQLETVCGVGASCGGCRNALIRLLADENAKPRQTLLAVSTGSIG